MKYLKKWYINLSIQRKILYCTLGVALVVLLAASVSQYMSASSIVTEQTRKQSAGVVNELSVNLDHYFDMVRNSFEYIANNSTVQEELESDEPYKSDGTELYSYYSRSGQIRRLLLQGYTSIYMSDCCQYMDQCRILYDHLFGWSYFYTGFCFGSRRIRWSNWLEKDLESLYSNALGTIKNVYDHGDHWSIKDF